MGGKKKYAKQSQPTEKQKPECKLQGDEKRFVNLLHVYTIYKQKFRRLKKEEFEELLHHGCKGKKAAVALSKELMKSKEIPEIVDFEKNVGFLSLPRLMPLVALLAERAEYTILPSSVNLLDFTGTPERFKDKFAYLMVYGFWFLGRVISDSLSVKEQVNRGNFFNFCKGDLGFWWAGVRILDWNCCVSGGSKSENCYSFVTRDPPKYRMYTSRAIINMHQHPIYFLSDLDWQNYTTTVQKIRHRDVWVLSSVSSVDSEEVEEEEEGSSFWSGCSNSGGSDFSSLLSDTSVNTLASRESID